MYVIVTHNGYKRENGVVKRINVNELPALKNWFDCGDWNDKPEKGTNYERLSKRTDKGDTPYNLRDCAYMDDFAKQKILYSETNSSITTKIAIDKAGCMTDKTCFIIVARNNSDTTSLYSVLSSDIFTWYMNLSAPRLGESGISLTKESVLTFPACHTCERQTAQEAYGFTDEEMKFISSSVRP